MHCTAHCTCRQIEERWCLLGNVCRAETRNEHTYTVCVLSACVPGNARRNCEAAPIVWALVVGDAFPGIQVTNTKAPQPTVRTDFGIMLSWNMGTPMGTWLANCVPRISVDASCLDEEHCPRQMHRCRVPSTLLLHVHAREHTNSSLSKGLLREYQVVLRDATIATFYILSFLVQHQASTHRNAAGQAACKTQVAAGHSASPAMLQVLD